ncbi:MAG: 30S ribosomal protein S17 [Candidatus Dadabacteria bacterium]
MERGKVKTRVGIVTSNKMDKTVIVDVVRTVSHPKYGKPIRRVSRFKAHDKNNECRIGDKVFITESRPLSRTKRWRVSRILERAAIIEGEPQEILSEGEKAQ